MKAPPATILRRIMSGALSLGLLGLLIWAGHTLLFTTFMIYDDEGYVLISLRNYGAHGQLYDAVYSQYGPGFFALYDLLATVLRFEWTNTVARWLNLGLWVGTAGFVAAVLQRELRQVWAAVLGFTATFAYLWIMIREPSHPGGLIGLLVATGAWLGSRRDPARDPATAAWLGGIGLLLLFTKINVGVFFLTSAGGWLLAHALAPRWRRVAAVAVGGWVALMPVLLMRKLAAEEWVPVFMAISALTSLAGWWVLQRDAKAVATPRVFATMIGTAAALGTLVIAVTLARGTTVGGLLHGVILGPLTQTNIYTFAFPWLPGSLVLAVATLGFVLLRPRLPVATATTLIHVVRIGGALALAASFLGVFVRSAPALGMSYGAALGVWCALSLPGTDSQSAGARTRRWLAWLLAGQFLHGFPVAGSQINWATFLILPLLLLGLHESWQRRVVAPRRDAWLLRFGPVVGLALAAVIAGKLARTADSYRTHGEFLGVPGAENLYVTDEIVFAQQSLVATAAAQGDMLYSVPGCFSFNLWTGLPTPTLANMTQWFGGLSEAQQHEIARQLAAADQPLVIVQRDLLQLLVDSGFSTAGPLATAIHETFVPVYSIDSYSLWARRGATVTPLQVARATPEGVEVTLTALNGPVARIDWWQLYPNGRHYLGSVDATPEVLELLPPDPATGASRLRLHTPPPSTDPAVRVLLILADAEGRRLASVRFLP